MFIKLIEVTVLWRYTYVNIYQIVHFNNTVYVNHSPVKKKKSIYSRERNTMVFAYYCYFKTTKTLQSSPKYSIN